MTADAAAVIADVLRRHNWRGSFLGCHCGWNWPEERTHSCGEDERIAKAHEAHQAAAVVAALGGLTRDRQRINPQGRGKPCDNCGHLKGVHAEPCAIITHVRRDENGWPLNGVECGCPEYRYTAPVTEWVERWVSGWTPEELTP